MIKNITTQTAFWTVNKAIAKIAGNDASILFSAMCEKFYYNSEKSQLLEVNGKKYFYFLSEDIEEQCNISYHQQKIVIEMLENLGFIDKIKKGLPAKLYFTINEKVVLNFLISEPINENQVPNNQKQEFENFKVCNSKNSKSTIEKNQSQEFENFEHIYNNTLDNNTLDNNTEIRGEPSFFSSNFSEDLREFYNANSHSILRGKGGARFFVQFCEDFHNHYYKTKGLNFLSYDYKTKQALVSIIDKIEKTIKAGENYDISKPIETQVIENFKFLLGNNKDTFVNDILSPAIIDKMFDSILSSIKNPKQKPNSDDSKEAQRAARNREILENLTKNE